MGDEARRCARETGASLIEYSLLLGLIAGVLTVGATVIGEQAEDVFRCTGVSTGDACVQGVTIERGYGTASTCLTGAGRDRCKHDLRALRKAARKAGLLPNALNSGRGGLAVTRR